MADKILNKLKELWAKITDWWNNFDSKQKTRIVIIGVAIVLAFVILYAVLSSPNYTLLRNCDSVKEASEITTVLDENDISYKVSDDGLVIKVPKKLESTARLTLAGSGIVPQGYTLEEALASGFTVTEADKSKRYKLYLETRFERDVLTMFTAIKSAKVTLYIPENDGTLLSKDDQAGAWVILALDDNEEFTSDNAAFVAKAIATVLGCKNTDEIVILDTASNLLFSGDDETSPSATANSQISVKKNAEEVLNAGVKKVLAGTGSFGDLKVTSNLIIDFSTTERTTHEYTPADGQSQGLLSEESSYTSDSTGGTSGAPGTDSNGETTYYYQDNNYSSSTIEELYKKYVPNEMIEYKNIPAGLVTYNKSSIAVSSVNYVVVKEDDVKERGLLDGITWVEYQEANSERRAVPITDEMISLVSDASGIPEDNITIVAYEENLFVDSEGLGIDIYDAIQIALIVIILVLLAIVVIKSMSQEKAEEEPEEISVETLLQSNPEPVLDDIGAEEISETRKMIEKFVDENPEAVANLLRNWLNEDWS